MSPGRRVPFPSEPHRPDDDRTHGLEASVTETTTEAEQTYQEAYHVHHTVEDLERAAKLYRLVIEQWPTSKQADFARTQIENIEEMSKKQRPKVPSVSSRMGSSTETERRSTLPGVNQSQYPVLGTISLLFQILAGINVLGLALVGFWSMSLGSMGTVVGIGLLLWAVFSGLLCWAISELIHLGVDIERNTRISAQYSLGKLQRGE
jgi:hypothetical protein